MDGFDKKILAQLQLNARQSVSAIAESVSLSRSAVSERIKRMEDSGEILGYQVVCKAGESSPVKAYFEVRRDGYHCESVARAAMLVKGIRHGHGISGDLDLLLYAEADSMAALHDIRNQLDKIPNIGKVTTHIAMREWKSAD
jgi:DNA-binding Lrp family transcriptional regulator